MRGFGPGPFGSIPEIRVTNDPGSSRRPSIAWTGSDLAVAFEDDRHGDPEIFVVRIADGTPGVPQRITTDPSTDHQAELVASGSSLGLTWERDATASDSLRFTILAEAAVGPEVSYAGATARAEKPSVARSALGFLLAWQDGRHGEREIYFARLDAGGMSVGAEVRVSEAPDDSIDPSIAANDSSAAVAWQDGRSGTDQVHVRTVTP